MTQQPSNELVSAVTKYIRLYSNNHRHAAISDIIDLCSQLDESDGQDTECQRKLYEAAERLALITFIPTGEFLGNSDEVVDI